MFVVAAAIIGGDVGIIGFGFYLFVVHSVWSVRILGVVLILIGIECRPRMPRLKKYGLVTDADSPHLRQLLDAVSAELGAPRIAFVRVEANYNASCERVGWRWRPALTIGLPLWAALDDDARLALLGHEVGHLVNGDPMTSISGVWGAGSVARLAEIFSPRAIRTYSYTRNNRASTQMRPLESLGVLVMQGLFVLPHLAFTRLTNALWHLAMRDHKRAEIYADTLGLRLGGSAGLINLQKALLFSATGRLAIRSAARGSADPAVWREVATAELAKCETATPRAIQLSLRHGAARYRSHPPAGLRLRLAQEWPAVMPSDIAPGTLMSAIDLELGPYYVDVRQTLAHQRV